MKKPKKTPPGRLVAIDQFRGFAILLMVLANYMNNVNAIPAWLKHTPDIGYTVIDLIAPMFVFAMGLTYGLSFRRRLARGVAWDTYQHFFTRYLALMGLGFLITLGWILSGIDVPDVNWGLLQALGAAGLITLPVIRFRPVWRFGIGLGLLSIYQVMLNRYWLDVVQSAPHNGPYGALSWGAMLILATTMADLYHDEEKGRQAYPWVAGLITIAGIILSLMVPLSKNQASASYILLSVGLSGLVFYLFHVMQSRWQMQLPILSEWGKNPLLLYLLHYLLLAIFALPPIPGWYVEAPLWLVVIQLILLIGVLSWVGRYFNQRGWFLSL